VWIASDDLLPAPLPTVAGSANGYVPTPSEESVDVGADVADDVALV
jgi:hypothetical protein